MYAFLLKRCKYNHHWPPSGNELSIQCKAISVSHVLNRWHWVSVWTKVMYFSNDNTSFGELQFQKCSHFSYNSELGQWFCFYLPTTYLNCACIKHGHSVCVQLACIICYTNCDMIILLISLFFPPPLYFCSESDSMSVCNTVIQLSLRINWSASPLRPGVTHSRSFPSLYELIRGRLQNIYHH